MNKWKVFYLTLQSVALCTYSKGGSWCIFWNTVCFQDPNESLGMRIGGGLGSNEGDIPIYIANIHPQGCVGKTQQIWVSRPYSLSLLSLLVACSPCPRLCEPIVLATCHLSYNAVFLLLQFHIEITPLISTLAETSLCIIILSICFVTPAIKQNVYCLGINDCFFL